MALRSFYDDAHSPDAIDIDKVQVYTDHSSSIFGGKAYRHRFGYECNGKLMPLYVCLEHPSFTGYEVHPPLKDPHHNHYPLYGSANLVNDDINECIRFFIDKLAEKAGATVTEIKYVTSDTFVYSVKCDQGLPEKFCTVDALTCFKVNGVAIQPVFRVCEKSGNWTCVCKIVIACVA